MVILKRIFNFYLNSSIHVAIGVYALTWITLLQFGVEYDKNSLNFVFFATITGYNFVKYFGIAKFHHRSLAGWLRAIQIFSFLAFIALCYYASKLEVNTLVLIAILGLITFLYAIPLLPKKYFIDDHKNLREISGLKIYVIALVWSFTTVILPLVNNEVSLDFDVVITSVQRFIYVLVLMFPFEIRDLNYDNLKLSTIPQKIGVKKTKIIGVFLLMIFMMLEFFKDELTSNAVIVTLIIVFITLLFIVFSNKNQSKYYSAFWVESLPIIWLGILLMLS
ncbi:hypothetical protein H8K90_14405 [Winogradskyella echinorum]|uniref:Prenyltransferase n=1 Tax=Winogradskyella echinorum TaxID=538189 RepID=A0ABR6Y497_9FLAO|nr:hypothetical protein [Winogradskyella echinorum]MBC3847585.1 hypothetical protein [Winogradskyella echinorum]MBC5751933.1 hypothetical protein [Winogradskyella echinorum]